MEMSSKQQNNQFNNDPRIVEGESEESNDMDEMCEFYDAFEWTKESIDEPKNPRDWWK